MPYAQQISRQRLALDPEKTLDMYRENASKINEPGPQFDFALVLIDIAMARRAEGDLGSSKKHLKEARTLLQKLADRSYPFAQYYLGDGYASGLLNDGKPDDKKAHTFFLAAGKHGHAEAAYRTALGYEFGWGTGRDIPTAVQYHRHAAAMRHPGAALRLGRACLSGDMGSVGSAREGVKWLNRSTDSADAQHNAAPYELGLLYESGFDAGDVFKNSQTAVTLFTQSASLGHTKANLRLGEIYDKGLLGSPRDTALSVHYYNCAAEAGESEAMMVLSAFFLVGMPPVLEQDYEQSFLWAFKAANEGNGFRSGALQTRSLIVLNRSSYGTVYCRLV